LLSTSSSLPESNDGSDRPAATEVAFSLLGFAPGGVYRANQVTLAAGALLPHRFTLTCAATSELGAAIGGLLSAALSLTSRPVGVTDHPVLWSPDFPLGTTKAVPSDHPTHSLATIRIVELRRWYKKAVRQLHLDRHAKPALIPASIPRWRFGLRGRLLEFFTKLRSRPQREAV